MLSPRSHDPSGRQARNEPRRLGGVARILWELERQFALLEAHAKRLRRCKEHCHAQVPGRRCGENEARAGDELVLRPGDPDFPLELRRTFALEMLSAVPSRSVQLLYSEPCVAPRSEMPRRKKARRHLRLVQ